MLNRVNKLIVLLVMNAAMITNVVAHDGAEHHGALIGFWHTLVHLVQAAPSLWLLVAVCIAAVLRIHKRSRE